MSKPFQSLKRRLHQLSLQTLILCHVFIPSVERCREEGLLDSAEALVQGLKSGRSFAVKDVAVRRWVPARMKP
jgi:tRNA-splicing endonuclease subunit Sen2